MTKCSGIMGLIFGHKWKEKRKNWRVKRRFYYRIIMKCQRCGCVSGEQS